MLLVVGVLPTTTTYAQCTLTAEVTNITCNNMTTTTTADDKFSFTLTVNSTSSTAETGGYVSVSINGTNVGGQNIGEAKEFVNQYNISGGVLNVTITAGSGNCSTTTTITPPQACSPGAGCTWDPLNLNPPYVTVTVQRDCKGTSDESDDEVSGTFSVTGIPAGYAAELDRKLDANGNGKEHIEGGITNGQVVNWGPYNVNTVKYPGQNGFVLWFMLEGITDCLGDYFVMIPNCPACTAPTPTGTDASICSGETAILMASGCTSGYTATWFSNSTLTSQLETGDSYETPTLTTTTNYYVSCVKDGDATCKSTGVLVAATVKPLPTLTAGTPTCAQNGLTYSVTVTSNGTISADAGTVSGTTVSNIPAGTDVTITATLNGCTRDITVTSPTCQIPCTAPTPTGTGASVCPDNTATLTASGCTTGYTATWFSDAGLNNQEGTGNSFTTPVLTATKNYYLSCVKNGDATCKSSGVTVTATVKTKPALSITNITCSGTTVTVTFTATAGATVTASAGTVSGNQVTGIPSGQTFSLTASLNGCDSTVSDSKTCAPNCDLNATLGVIKCIAGQNTPEVTDDSFTFDLTVTGTGGASNLWEAVYNGTVIQTGAYGQTKTVTVSYSTWNGAANMAIIIRDKDNTSCTDNVSVQVPSCSPAPCTGFKFTNIVASCEGGLHKICLDVSGTGGRKWAISLKHSNDFNVPGIPFADGTGDQTGVCGTISSTDFAILQAFDADDFIVWGMLELSDGTPIFGTGCEIDSVVRYSPCVTCQAPTPVGTGASVCSGTSATLTASGCSTGYTTTWFSDAGLGTQVGTGTSYTTLVLTSNTNYYVACVKDGDATCKSSGVTVTASVKPKPTISVTSTTCNQAGTFYDVAFSATSGATVTADKGTVTGSTVVGVPSGQVVKLVVSLNGCKDSTTATKNCSVPCVESTFSLVGTPSCSADYSTYSLTIQVNNKIGIVKTNKGILSGNNPYTITGIPAGSPVIITDSLSAVCKADTMIVAPNCNCNPALPQLLTPSLTACIGDTFPTLKATVVGLATVEWFSQQTGGTVLATGLSFKPSGTVTANTIFYAQARSTDPTCPTAVSTSRVPATINAQDCTKEVDLALSKSISKKIAQIGDVLTYTLKVWNESATNATGVSVTDSIATTVQFVSGSFSPSRGSATISGNVIKWNIGNIAAAGAPANGDTVTLTYQIKVTQEGVHFNTAEICTTNEKDVDSTPCNHDDTEDDIDRACFTVPVKLCPGEVVEVNVPVNYTNVQWFKSGSTTPVASGNSVLLTDLGSYTFTATNQTCPAEGCCPVIIEAGTNCCPVDLCIPFTIKQTKKAGKKL